MKKLLLWVMVLTGIMLSSCTKDEDSKNEPGSIYGIVTKFGAAEPMKAVGVELYKKGTSTSPDALLMKTVTFDDGHFEFKDLNPENYQVKVAADGYDQIEDGYVIVEAGRQARIDLQVKYHNSTEYTIIGNLMIQATDLGSFYFDEAERMCKASRVAGYTDWRLPTIDELRTMYTEKEKLNMNLDNYYWSSSIGEHHYEYNNESVRFRYIFEFSHGISDGVTLESLEWEPYFYNVRAVRTVK